MVSSKATTVAQYLAELPPDRLAEIERVRDAINASLPDGYSEGIGFGMILWFVPLECYPNTYNKQPLGYAALAAQKNYNSLYLNCVYSSKESSERVKKAFEAAGIKPDMGKCCIRFKTADKLPLEAIKEEIASTSPDEFIRIYEEARASGRGG